MDLKQLKRAAVLGCKAFRIALNIAKDATDGVPIVKPVLGGVAALLKHFDVSDNVPVRSTIIRRTYVFSLVCRTSEKLRMNSLHLP